jgi:3-deoxy-D-manno-octulosonic acid kinase
MARVDAIESLTTLRHGREGHGDGMPVDGAPVDGAILFDATRVPQPQSAWFDPAYWGRLAQPVASGGRGGAWYVDAPFGAAVLRHYLRGGLAARVSRDRYLWQGEDRVRSFAEFRLTEALHRRGLPVATPLAASYLREGASYRAAILLERLHGVRTLAERIAAAAADAPWEAAGRTIARFHRAGLDHADLNAHNILFDATDQAWLIDFDRSRLRKPAATWRRNNLTRLLRSLHKLRGARSRQAVEADFARLQDAYDAAMERVP